MTRSEFLQELRQALENDLSGSIVQENVEFYSQYIAGEVLNGKSEEDVIQMLGDPWILARTVIDAQNGADKETVYEAGGNNYAGYGSRGERTHERSPEIHTVGLNTRWKKLLLILAIVMLIVVIFSIISGVISLLAPILVPIVVIMIVVRVLGNRRR